MNGLDHRKHPMCRSKKAKGTTRYEDNGTGGKVKVTRYKDGSSITHWGGMAGNAYYNSLGEET